MKAELKVFLLAAQKLCDAWNEDEVKNYPKYLPSFDEFIAEFADLLGK